MTDPPRDHLDDEGLSAVLDGEAAPNEDAHAQACAECSARLAALREVATFVGAPVAPATDAQREAAIAAALAAAAPSNVVPMRSRRRGVPVWLGAAAAAVVAVAAIGLIGRSTGDDDDSADVASGGAGDDTTAEMAADEAGDAAATLQAVGPVEGGDLGAIEDVDLEVAIGDAMARREVAETTVADEESSGGDDDASTATTPAPSAAAGSSFASSCEDPVRAGDPELGALVYRATGTYEDEPAVVFGFDVLRADGGVDRRVYVLAVEGCTIRLAETWSA